MRVGDRLRDLFTSHPQGGDTHHSDDGRDSEEDVPVDPGVASSRATGGEHAELSGDRGSVTGTGRTEGFVGRAAGDDLGYAGETGAERRAEAHALGHGPAGTGGDDTRS